ncbi:MAG: T9SS type A sorting domain-containing protein [Bacteroidales bacterium]|nr:T9SS type A sorting domain-containing protein [Bacteroidales bacterium]MBN2762520.1 T9SS type A sorting domain-containing protein [Bacteroidales bacterium]
MKKLFTLLLMAFSIQAFSVNITFNLKMSGQDLPLDTVFIVGSVTNWEFQPMFDLGDSLYTWSTSLDPGTVDGDGNDSLAYYFITVNSWDSAGNQDWTYYQRYREWFDSACVADYPLRYGSDRYIVVPETDVTIMCYFGKCPNWEPSSGLAEKEKDLAFDIFPNPAGEEVTLRLPRHTDVLSVELFDISGKALNINQARINNTLIKLKTGTLPKGVYFIKVKDREFSGVRKLIVN